MNPDIRTRWNPPGHVAVSFIGDPGMTKQSFAEETNINTIMARFKRTGVLIEPGSMGTRQPLYGDFSSGMDYLEVQQRIVDAGRSFATLPASVRRRFMNEPGFLIDFLSDEANREEAEKLGLVKKAPSVVPPISGTPAEQPAAVVPAVEAGGAP